MKPIGVNEHRVCSMFDLTERLGPYLVTCRVPRVPGRSGLPFWVLTRDDGVSEHVPDPPSES